MSLLIKSEKNLSAALFLKDKYLDSAIHCLYYSCYQYIVYLLKAKFKEHEFLTELRGKDSHKECVNKINSLITYHDKNIIKKNMKTLKILRKKSDYQEDLILEKDFNDAKNNANRILEVLKKYKV